MQQSCQGAVSETSMLISEDNYMHIYKSRRYRWVELLLRWQQNAAVQWLLFPLAFGYCLLSALRIWLYRCLLPRHRLPASTISVGNIVSGGSGKTPIVIAIGQQLIARGERVVVLSRGYGSSLRRNEFIVLRNGKIVLGNTKVRALDEARLLTHALPQATVIAAPRRYAACKAYLAATKRNELPTYFLLDDGFQHVQIQRDLDIVLLDAAQPFADERLLPCGRLRELSSALRRADLVLFTRATAALPSALHVRQVQQQGLRTVRVKFNSPALQSSPTTDAPFSHTLNPVLFICGVAAPAKVFAAVHKLGVQVRIAFYLADHEAIDRTEVCRLARHVNALVMTAKDYWRDDDFYQQQPLPVYIITLMTDFDFAREV